MTTTKVQIKITCQRCEGKAYLPVGEAESYSGERYTRYAPCTGCQGTGQENRWVNLDELVQMIAVPAVQGVL